MNLVMLGKPGAGKGSVCEEFTKNSDCIHLSTGDIFRKEIAAKTPLGILADSYISQGLLVPDDVTNNIIKNILSVNPNASYVFDGYPRTVNQAEALNKMMKEIGIKLDAVIELEVLDSLVLTRLTSRRVCSSCGAIYNLRNHPPKVEGICDNCGAKVIQREDDRVDAIQNRLNVYRAQTQPLIDYYKKENLLKVVDGDKDAHDDYLDIMEILHNE